MCKLINNNKGAALVLVLISMVVLSILGATILNVSLAETKFSIRNETNIQAENIAKSGSDLVSNYYINNPTTSTMTFNESLGEGSFNVTITKMNTSTVLIESTGTIDSLSQKVSVILTKNSYQDLFKGIRQTGEGDLDLSALPLTYDAPITIEANVTDVSDITLNSGNVSDPNIVTDVNNSSSGIITYPVTTGFITAVSIDGDDSPITGDYKIGTLSKSNNETITFNTEGRDQQIVVDTLDIKGPHGNIEIIGGGSVHLYILEEGDIQTPVSVNNSDPGILFIYVADGKNISLSANGDVNAYIYAPNATIEIQSSNTTVIGAMIGEIINRGNSNGAHGRFHYKPLSDEPDHNAIEDYKKSMYVK